MSVKNARNRVNGRTYRVQGDECEAIRASSLTGPYAVGTLKGIGETRLHVAERNVGGALREM
jgi:hypothetical protein